MNYKGWYIYYSRITGWKATRNGREVSATNIYALKNIIKTLSYAHF